MFYVVPPPSTSLRVSTQATQQKAHCLQRCVSISLTLYTRWPWPQTLHSMYQQLALGIAALSDSAAARHHGSDTVQGRLMHAGCTYQAAAGRSAHLAKPTQCPLTCTCACNQ